MYNKKVLYAKNKIFIKLKKNIKKQNQIIIEKNEIQKIQILKLQK